MRACSPQSPGLLARTAAADLHGAHAPPRPLAPCPLQPFARWHGICLVLLGIRTLRRPSERQQHDSSEPV